MRRCCEISTAHRTLTLLGHNKLATKGGVFHCDHNSDCNNHYDLFYGHNENYAEFCGPMGARNWGSKRFEIRKKYVKKYAEKITYRKKS